MNYKKIIAFVLLFTATITLTIIACVIFSKNLITQETVTLLIRKHDLYGNLQLERINELFYFFVQKLEVMFKQFDASLFFFPSVIKTLIWTRQFLNVIVLLPALFMFSVIFFALKNKVFKIIILLILICYIFPIKQLLIKGYDNTVVNLSLNYSLPSQDKNTWIWGGYKQDENYYPYTSFTFNWKQKDNTDKAWLRISSLGHYQFFVNNQFVGSGPSFGVYPRIYYDNYNIADYLLIGENNIKIIVNYISEPTHEYYNYTQPGLLVGGLIKDGIFYRNLSDWRFWQAVSIYNWSNSLRISGDAGYAEVVDLTTKPVGQQRASRIKLDQFKLEPRPLPMLTYEKIKPPIDNSVMELGMFSTGYLQIDSQLEKPCVVTTNWLVKGHTINDPYSNQSDKITFPAGYTIWTQFSRRSGESVYLDSGHCQGSLASTFIRVGMPFIVPEYSYSGNAIDEYIYKISLNSLVNNVQNHFEDCVEREKSMYIGDAYQVSKCLAVGGNGKLIKEMIRRSAQRQEENGMIPSMTPANVKQFIPSYSLQWVVWLSWYVNAFDDINFAQEMAPNLTKVMNWAKNNESQGGYLTNVTNEQGWWNFIDWTPINDSLTYQTALQIWYYHALKTASTVSSVSDAKEYRQQADKLKQGLINLAYDKNGKLFADSFSNEQKIGYSLVTNSLAGLSELFPSKSDSAKAYNYFVKQGDIFTNSPYSQSWVVEWLLKDKNYNEALSSIRGYWGSMVNAGASSIYENYSLLNGKSGSYSHAWGCGPIYFYQELSRQQGDNKKLYN